MNTTQKFKTAGTEWENRMLSDIEQMKPRGKSSLRASAPSREPSTEAPDNEDPNEAGRQHITRLMRLQNEAEGINANPKKI